MKSSNVSVRSANEADVATLVAFNRAMAAESEDKGLQEEVLERGVRYLLAHPAEGFYLVAEADGLLAGTLMVTFEWSDWRDGRFWWIQSVYVSPDHRRMGVYSALHQAVRSRAAGDPQACGIRLYVERENLGAQATYQSLDMVETAYRLYEEEF
ncbi:MAG: GNAT family N-acetyltransferase [Gammaproteobacteria bacterium]|nr:GNAT family N-acetyltransferase [Gammaproteobacteria bacterium]